MNKDLFYKLTILFLLVIIVIQWGVILRKPPIREKPAAFKGKIAVVLDDWGYNLNNLRLIEQIRQPLTASVLPNLPYSREISSELNNRGVEIILHLPMQPHENYRLEKNTLFITFDTEHVRAIIDDDLSSIAYARGVSNHMGSLATEDERLMEIIFKHLKNKRLFFLDSFVTPKSVCRKLAQRVGIGFAKRDIFLDNKPEAEYILGQIKKLKSKARTYGYAVGIGHDHRLTLQVLKEVLPQLEKEGYKIVFLSELVK